MDNLSRPEPLGWSKRQRLGIGMLLVALLIPLIVLSLSRPLSRSNPPPSATSLPRRVDPNTASLALLTTIPHLGPAIGAKIVTFREAHASPDRPVFRTLEDLSAVPGVGARLAEELAPYLDFPESQP